MAEKAAPGNPSNDEKIFKEDRSDSYTPVVVEFFRFINQSFSIPDPEEAKKFMKDVQHFGEALEKDEENILEKIKLLKDIEKNLVIRLEGIKKEGQPFPEGLVERLAAIDEIVERNFIRLGSVRATRKILEVKMRNAAKTIAKNSNNPFLEFLVELVEHCECDDCKMKNPEKE